MAGRGYAVAVRGLRQHDKVLKDLRGDAPNVSFGGTILPARSCVDLGSQQPKGAVLRLGKVL